jgi:polysaccharide deacetylase family protein (PEP-CTERM system associated)
VINALTVDVEDYFHVIALSKVIRREQWDTMPYRAEANTHRLLQLFEQRKVKATFFVLGWVAKRSPQLVRDILAAGHEIASHGMSHKLVFNQTRDEFFAETRDSKALLEDITGVRIDGYRASTYSITRQSLWALDVLCELGFTYDSSIFPIRHDVYGIPDAPVRPSRITAPSGSRLIEFPMSTAQYGPLRIPVSGGGYFRLLPYALTRSALRKLNGAEQRPFVFYLHPWEIDPGQPRIAASWFSRFRHYNNLDQCEARLGRLLQDFSFAPMRQVLASLDLLESPAQQTQALA